MVTRWSEKSPGLKILWIWTFGTAAVLITNVVATRMRDMDKMMREEDALRSQSQPQSHPAAPSPEIVLKDE